MKFPSYVLVLILIVLLGLFFRIYKLDTESIWLDEGISLKLAQNRPAVITLERALNNHPPLYFIALHYWIRNFGTSIPSARTLSAIFGFLSILLIYMIGIMCFDKETGVLSSLIMSFSVFQIYYSQEIRMYSLSILLALTSMYFFIRLFKEKGLKSVAGYIISTAALLYTHFSGLLIVLLQNIYFVTIHILNKKSIRVGKDAISAKRWTKYEIILFLLYLPWFLIGVFRFKKIQGLHLYIAKPSLGSVFSTLIDYSGSFLHFGVFAVLLVLLFLPIKRLRKKMNLHNVENIYLLLLWLFVPAMILFIISYVSNPIYVTKYTMVASPALYLLVALSVTNIKPRNLKLFTIGVIIILSLANVWRYTAEINKIPWRESASYMRNNAKRGDLVIFNDALCSRHAFEYYLRRGDLHKKLFPEKWEGKPYTIVNRKNVKDLKRIAGDHKRVWIVLAHTIDKEMLINKEFLGSYKLLYHKIYPARSYITHRVSNYIEVFLFEKN